MFDDIPSFDSNFRWLSQLIDMWISHFLLVKCIISPFSADTLQVLLPAKDRGTDIPPIAAVSATLSSYIHAQQILTIEIGTWIIKNVNFWWLLMVYWPMVYWPQASSTNDHRNTYSLVEFHRLIIIIEAQEPEEQHLGKEWGRNIVHSLNVI
jgi:hypothetical protein